MDLGLILITLFFLGLGGGLIYLVTRGSAGSKRMICPNQNCGYKGQAKKISRGSVLIGLILCLFFIIPGIIYFIFMGGYKYVCPQCGIKIDSDN